MPTPPSSSQEILTLEEAVRHRLTCYFKLLETHEGTPPSSLYDMILSEVEKPLIQETLRFCGNNQSKASTILGLNRNTLKKKMQSYGL